MSDSAANGRVSLTIEGATAHITFDRPAARNAMTWAMYEDLKQACASIAADDAVRMVVLRGAGGKAFIAGTDISQFQSFETGADGIDYERRIGEYVAAVAALAVPTIAVVEGWAVGGGMAIASVCDFRLATPGARFGVPIARTLGNCLSQANVRVLIAMVGVPIVKRMLLLAEMIPAEELTASGYVLKTVTAGEIDDAVTALCEQLSGHAPLTMAASKAEVARIISDFEDDDQAIVEQVYGSADFREGVAAFVSRRTPLWTGR
jgi:enoyl-CoA hydratase